MQSQCKCVLLSVNPFSCQYINVCSLCDCAGTWEGVVDLLCDVRGAATAGQRTVSIPDLTL